MKQVDGLTRYLTELYEDQEASERMYFMCCAEDACHALEQARNAYPDGRVIRVSPEESSAANAADELREAGFAVVMFSREELDGVCPRLVEDTLVRVGWETMESNMPRCGRGE